MSLKSSLKTGLILLLLMALHFIQSESFSPLTVAYRIENVEQAAAVDQAYKYFTHGTFNWEMITPDYTLVMTTGNDQFHQSLHPVSGYFANPVYQEAILSKSVASSLIKTDQAAFQSLKLLNRPYLVKAVLKEGNKIYIPFDPALLDQQWHKTTFYYTADPSQSIELQGGRLANLFETTGIEVLFNHYYKDSYYLFYNLGILTLWTVLYRWAKTLHSKATVRKLELLEQFEAEQPFSRWQDFLRRERQSVLKWLGTWGLLCSCGGISLLLIFAMKIPLSWIPENWFSPKAYWDVGASIVSNLQLQLSYGFFPINQLCFMLIGILLLFLVFIHYGVELIFSAKTKNSK